MHSESAKLGWVGRLPRGEAAKSSLATLVEADQARDEAEVEYYEAAFDPHAHSREAAQRRFRAQFRRRQRHLLSRHRPPEDRDA